MSNNKSTPYYLLGAELHTEQAHWRVISIFCKDADYYAAVLPLEECSVVVNAKQCISYKLPDDMRDLRFYHIECDEQESMNERATDAGCSEDVDPDGDVFYDVCWFDYKVESCEVATEFFNQTGYCETYNPNDIRNPLVQGVSCAIDHWTLRRIVVGAMSVTGNCVNATDFAIAIPFSSDPLEVESKEYNIFTMVDNPPDYPDPIGVFLAKLEFYTVRNHDLCTTLTYEEKIHAMQIFSAFGGKELFYNALITVGVDKHESKFES